VEPSSEDPQETPASSMREIWEYAESARLQVLQHHLKELVKWVVKRISVNLLKGGPAGKLDVAFIEASRNIDCENVFAPDFLRFDSVEQMFVSPCGSEFKPDEVLKPISESLRESGIDIEFRIMTTKNRTTTFQISYSVNPNETLSNSVSNNLVQLQKQKMNGMAKTNGSSLKKPAKQGA
jgi:hypothetical protein